VELIVVLLIVGAVLLILETILPGLVAGILGLICLLAGIIAGYTKFGAGVGNWILTGVVLGLVGGFAVWVKVFPDTRMARVFVSKRVVGNIDAARPELLNQTGTAYTQLRPSGTALINGKRVDVVTEGSLIERGTPIKVVAIEGARVVVRATADQSANAPEFKPIKT